MTEPRPRAEAPIASRKVEHIAHALDPRSQRSGGARWEDVRLVHDAVPAVDADAVDLSTTFLGRELRLPLVIAGMTGGHDRATEINRNLALAAEAAGVALGLGSQRAMLRNPALARSYAVAREAAPSAMLLGNLGIAQLVDQDDEPAVTLDEVNVAIATIEADAMAVHLNALEESVQPEGQTRVGSARPRDRGSAAAEALQRMVADLAIPVVAKETGAGVSRGVAQRLAACGVGAIDVGGFGGTSFAAIEAERARARGHDRLASLGAAFADWGIPTAVAVAGCAPVLPVVATGGVRGGLDAARAIALGATAVGVGRPLLERALESARAVLDWIAGFELELRTAVYLTGGSRVCDLRDVPRVILGETKQWIDQLGYA
jgi:isopentenyl-diphosphate delta-isomerase